MFVGSSVPFTRWLYCLHSASADCLLSLAKRVGYETLNEYGSQVGYQVREHELKLAVAVLASCSMIQAMTKLFRLAFPADTIRYLVQS